MKMRLFVFSAVILLGLVVSLALRPKSSPSALETDLVKMGTPDQILAHIKELRSPLVLVNFWASWCEPCKQEFPNILELRSRHASDGLQVIFVSIDEPADLSSAQAFLKEHKVNFPSFYRGTQPLGFVNKIYPKWSGAIPMSLLMNKDAEILDAWEGDTSLDEFESRVKNHLPSKGT